MTTYYGNDYPKSNEVVFVVISEFSDDSIYCDLVEYGCKKGLLQRKELDKKIRYNPKKHFFENKVYPMLVLDVDELHGHIDLNYSRIKEKEREQYMENFNYFSKLYNMMHEFIVLSSLNSGLIYPQTLWKFLQKDNIDNSRELFLSIMDEPGIILDEIKNEHPNEVTNYLIDLEPRIIKTSMFINQEFKLALTCSNAVDALKEILRINNPDFKIEYINAPKYRIIAEGKTQQECYEKIEKCLEEIKKNMDRFQNKVIFCLGEKKIIKEREISIKYKNILY
ncbi:eukaryotic translation initiation factor eIF-2 alpha [Bodo saltans virus]|uniref:Eukaryotic translation initiation factor eIF-2 alpha n=1 Tax=Bodo saltans virus TaxID=2024608 RepID=A0A2H4UV38_9VIRU|nr:eukaryotic translation initiation factor eIF-2 alpha [Bodo saltans virus]ATZ80727.1 eukaryotic translation initiation factor eIF-2 alpha [Bodo saltans virus]